METLQGKIALVTGGSRGLGQAIALALARAGVDVAINFRSREDAAHEVAKQISEPGRRALCVRADVSQSAEVQRMVGEVEVQPGPVDILVNNAGIARQQPIESITESDWDELLAVNLKSCFLVTQAVIGGMRARCWGRIVNLSSVAAQTGGVIGPHYAASKAGMLGLTRSYASLLAGEGITANAIAPALIETDMVAALSPAVRARIPVGRLGNTSEVADVAVLLAANGYITGQTINVNGGWYLS